MLGFSQFKTAYQKHANELASQCGGRFNRADFLKAIEVPYREAFRSENVLKAFEVTGTWPVNRNRINADQTATSIGLSLYGEATIAPTSPVKAIHAVLSHLQAPAPEGTPIPTSSTEATGSDTTNAALQHAIDNLHTKLQCTHASFLFDGSAPSSAHKVQPLQFLAPNRIPTSNGPCELDISGSLESQSKAQLCLQVQLLQEESTRIQSFVQELITDRMTLIKNRTTLITHCSLLFAENEKLRLGLFRKEQRRQTARERISPGGRAIHATADNTMALISTIDTEKRAAAGRKGSSQGVPGMSQDEKARRREVWKRAVAEHSQRKEKLKMDGILVKYAGKRPLLKCFLDAQDPEILLQELRTQEHASSSPARHQTRCQCHQIAQLDEDDEEWVDTDSVHDDLEYI